jgi:hypothetical protein
MYSHIKGIPNLDVIDKPDNPDDPDIPYGIDKAARGRLNIV